MNLDKLVAVSGMSGVYRMSANRSNGLIVEEIPTGKLKFASVRKHQFTPLESIGIYTDDGDTAALKEVFGKMLEQVSENPPVDPSSDTQTLFEYLAKVLPNFDRDRVHAGDVKKLIRWFSFLHEHGLTQAVEEEVETTKEEEEPEA
ncbi:MAG: DUF5606 domain-containing protein [Saprospiraceae bacterium]|nr:DUF5606 domain-containing protein [Saprospiraceae bacterium]HRD82241.1 DUF5606 domain-containing protein [Saprospiraceae bacterium]HRK80091.1 DUF5606 domain-containing protein [Saprospiraceae bacterium]